MKKKTTALLLSIFLGSIGIDRFYQLDIVLDFPNVTLNMEFVRELGCLSLLTGLLLISVNLWYLFIRILKGE